MTVHPLEYAGVSALLSLEGCSALVTGARGGIGVAVARLLREAGARVTAADVTPAPDVDEASDDPRHPARHVVCDLSDAAACARLVEETSADGAGLDLLVHCAGITRDGVMWKLSDDDWTRVLSVNLDSAFWLLRAASPRLRESGRASVVLVSSINGERGKFGQSNYAASKAGLIALAKTAAKELGPKGVRVNAVAPGLIDTPMTAGLPREVRERAVAETALGRAGTPDDVARAVLFLCSPLASHVTGQVLRVDGGQLTA